MNLFMVRRYCDESICYEHGIDDQYYLVGIFSTKEEAERVRDREARLAEYSSSYERIDILEVVLDVDYSRSGMKQPYLGGGCYVG